MYRELEEVLSMLICCPRDYNLFLCSGVQQFNQIIHSVQKKIAFLPSMKERVLN